MKLFVTVLLVVKCYVSTQSVEDFYWRDFKGLIPSDAIPVDGKPEESIFVGQFTVSAEYNTDVTNLHTLVATLYRGKQRAVAAYNGRTVYSNETSNLKILCASNIYRYQWKEKNSVFSPSCRFVVAGNEDNIPLYVGRTDKGKEKVIGKVFSDTSFHEDKLFVAHQGGEEKFDMYQILTFCY